MKAKHLYLAIQKLNVLAVIRFSLISKNQFLKSAFRKKIRHPP